MNNIKDTNNKGLEKKNQSMSLIDYSSKHIKQTPSKLLADRAQKIVTAVYLITDLIYIKDNLRESIRQSSLDALESLFNNYSSDYDLVSLNKAQYDLYAMLSYVDVVYKIGGISEMNYSILVKETHALQKAIAEQINSKGIAKNDSFNLSDFFISETSVKDEPSTVDKQTPSLSNTDVQVEKNNVTLQTKNNPLVKHIETTKTKGQKKDSKQEVKSKRHSDILSILEQKKNASIKDICLLFKDCSSKTIQRDLNTLIANKKVVKRGDRRWAVYNIARR